MMSETKTRSRIKAADFRTKVDGRRRYRSPRTGEHLPSVTDILSTLYPTEALTNWKLRNQVDYCRLLVEEDRFIPFDLEDDFDGTEWNRYRDRVVSESLKFHQQAAAYGSLVHDMFEALYYGDDSDHLYRRPGGPEALASALDIHRWLEKKKLKIVHCEVAAFSSRYAGTIDLILYHKPSDRNLVADIKTGKTINYNTSSELQIAAYAQAQFLVSCEGEVVEIPDLNLSSKGLIVHCPSDIGVVAEGKLVDFYVAAQDWTAALYWYERRGRKASR